MLLLVEHTSRYATADGPPICISSRVTSVISGCNSVNEPGGPDSTTTVVVAPLECVARSHVSAITFTSPTPTTSLTTDTNSKVMIPPSSLAFHWLWLPPSCWTIRTFPNSPASIGVPKPWSSVGYDVSKRRAFPLGMKPPEPGANSSAPIFTP